ncbi:MAG: chemotaxis protein CheA, partial [Spirochaetaceae bacterium]|nr:chemotaxis protein CheA [Spirochaetaceae bacterium]
PSNHEAIDEIFRAAHTLKGGSATVEMHELSGFTHVMEDLLDELRSGTITVTEPVVDALLSAIDIIKEMLDARANGSIYSGDAEPVKNTLKGFLPGKDPSGKKKAAPVQAPAPAAKPVQEAPSSVTLSEYDYLEMEQARGPGETLWAVTVEFDESNPMNSVGGIQVFAALKERGSILKTVPDFDVLFEDDFHPTVVYYLSTKADGASLEKASTISDVTLSSKAQGITNAAATASREEAAPAPKQTASAPPVKQEPPAKPESSAAATDRQEAPAPQQITPAARHREEGTQESSKKTSSGGNATHAGGSVLRVDSRRIDYLLNLVSETVITKASFNQTAMQFSELLMEMHETEASYKDKVRQLFDELPKHLEGIQNGSSIKEVKKTITTEYGDLFTIFDVIETTYKSLITKFRSSSQNLGRIASELQEGVMKIRMVPISQIFSRFPRLVRDMSRDLDKKINLVIEGEETELDKSVIEDLLDPIMHCVRNSLDHGIENPDVRKAEGKNEEGTLLLKASNEGNMIVIEIGDDGKGIDVEAVRQKAIDRGIIHPSKLITDQEAFQLIFEAGFSTASKITNLSGRGVGLDVVKTQIEKLNGSVTVSSEPGMGTKFSIRLPLTLAIIQGLLVRVGKEVYSIPITSVIESHRVRKDEISTIDNYEVLNVRNEVISILRLNQLFGIKTEENTDYRFIVIVGTSDKKVGLMIDGLIGEEDVVIKPLRDQFTNSPGIAGASILGDGSVSLIIDVSQLLDLGMKQELYARQQREARVW